MKNKKFQFDYDLSGLSAWADERADEFLLKSILGMETARYARIYPNVKGETVKVPVLQSFTGSPFQDSTSCPASDSGSTEITQVTIDMCYKSLKLSNCTDALRDYFTSQALQNGLFLTEQPFAEAYAQDLSNRTADYIEKVVWGEESEACLTGYKDILTGSTAISAATASALTSTNAFTVIDTLINALPTNVQRRADLIVWMSYSNYRALTQAMRTASSVNLFALDGAEDGLSAGTAIVYPATDIRVIPTQGISDNFICVGPASNLLMGLNSDGVDMRMDYDVFDDKIKVLVKTGFGTGIANPEEFAYLA